MTRNSAALEAITKFNSSLVSLPSDISSLQVFADGVKGVSTSQIQTSPVNALVNTKGIDDDFTKYSKQLKNYLTVLNQIATLNNRITYLSTALDLYNFNPIPEIDISGYVTPLMNIYQKDVITMRNNLGTCLNSSSSKQKVNCKPIDDAYTNNITSAYLWYGASGSNPNNNPNNFAQQNTIGLQYTGIVNYTGATTFSFPVDVVWAQALPQFWYNTKNPTNTTNTNPAGNPAIIAFADAPWQFDTGPMNTTAWVTFFPLNIAPTINPTINPIISQPMSAYLPYSYSLGNTQWWTDTGSSTQRSTLDCSEPTFDLPCSIATNTAYNGGKSILSVNLHQIPNFFTP
jgi:hypothetical protein